MYQEPWLEKYRFVRQLGEGATSKVYLAVHMSLNQPRAIKCIQKDNISCQQARLEANLLNQLKSPYVPTIYDIEEDQQFVYIIEEFIEGESLLQYRRHTNQLPEREIIKLSIQICEIIQYLHSNPSPILYLDLKPENLMIDKGKLKLIDFGAARYKEQTDLSGNYGTKAYAAPEMFKDSRLDEKSDLYGIGMLIFYLTTGSNRYTHEKLLSLKSNPEFSKAFLKVMEGCLEQNPCLRYYNVQVVKQRLVHLNSRRTKRVSRQVHPIKIALAGAQKRIGVTHLAFMLTSYLVDQGYHAIYIEDNSSSMIQTLVPYSKVKNDYEIYYRNICLSKAEWMEESRLTAYDYIIYDFGEDLERLRNQREISSKLVVLGGKEWELQVSAKAIERMKNEKMAKFIFNQTEERRFRALVKHLRGITLYSITYENDPFCKVWSQRNRNVMAALIE